ncbi:bZIP transcription factor [Nitzschia inconspicua]|uniref:BZIP transcription factor n=1 Tax=Nitzschia inconspicua TaxID=303405 RepID=A0A9K3LG90_9STRA|nr:bZIP transcription factor [Nitzschia inconspicua]
MKRQSNPSYDDAEGRKRNLSPAVSRDVSGNKSRKRKGQHNPQQQAESSNTLSIHPVSTIPIEGMLGSNIGAWAQGQHSQMYQPAPSLGHYLALQPGEHSRVAANSTANIAGWTGAGFNPIYAGNIAAACEAANQEVAQKQKDTNNDADDEIRRKKAVSRITAWQSRERKRIEMEVLQDRKAELVRRNADLRSENEQIRLLIENLKAAVVDYPRSFPQTQQFIGTASTWTGSSSTGTIAQTKGSQGLTSKSGQAAQDVTQPSHHTHPLFLPTSRPLYEHSSSGGATDTAQSAASFVQQQQLGLQQYQTLLAQHHLMGISLADLAGLQQRVQMQQRPGSHDTSLAAGAFSIHGAASRPPMGLYDTLTPLAREQRTTFTDQAAGLDIGRQAIPPNLPHPEDSHGALPLDITSLLAPPANFQVDVPLIRALPKRREPENSKDESLEKKKDTG